MLSGVAVALDGIGTTGNVVSVGVTSELTTETDVSVGAPANETKSSCAIKKPITKVKKTTKVITRLVCQRPVVISF